MVSGFYFGNDSLADRSENPFYPDSVQDKRLVDSRKKL
jgi:hypothetical protein